MDAILGRTGELLSHNLFSYCSNNPMIYHDPSGFARILDREGTGAGGGAGGGSGYSGSSRQILNSLKTVISKVVGKADDFAKTPFVPNEYWKRNAPDFNTPGSKITHLKDNKGVVEKSMVIYDDFGRQKWRVDYNNHGYKDHSIPHLHERTFGTGLDPEFGKEIRYDWWR